MMLKRQRTDHRRAQIGLPWLFFFSVFFLPFFFPVGMVCGETASTKNPPHPGRPPFINAWFGPDFPLSPCVPLPLPGPVCASGGVLLATTSAPLFDPEQVFPPFNVVRARPGVLALPFRASAAAASPTAKAFLLRVEFEAVDLPMVAVQFADPHRDSTPPLVFAFFTAAGPAYAQREAWFVFDAIQAIPAGHEMRIVGQAGVRISRVETWAMAHDGPKYWRLAIIEETYQRMLQRSPTPSERRFARRSILNRAVAFDVFHLRLAMGDEFRHRFVAGHSRTRVIERLHWLIHARPILEDRLYGALGAWNRAGFDGAVTYLLTLESSVLDNPAVSQQRQFNQDGGQ